MSLAIYYFSGDMSGRIISLQLTFQREKNKQKTRGWAFQERCYNYKRPTKEKKERVTVFPFVSQNVSPPKLTIDFDLEYPGLRSADVVVGRAALYLGAIIRSAKDVLYFLTKSINDIVYEPHCFDIL